MRYLSHLVSTLILCLFTLTLHAQSGAENNVEMADLLHQNGKIYLVVLVLVTIFAGVLFMLIRIERKLAKLEQNTSNS